MSKRLIMCNYFLLECGKYHFDGFFIWLFPGINNGSQISRMDQQNLFLSPISFLYVLQIASKSILNFLAIKRCFSIQPQ